MYFVSFSPAAAITMGPSLKVSLLRENVEHYCNAKNKLEFKYRQTSINICTFERPKNYFEPLENT